MKEKGAQRPLLRDPPPDRNVERVSVRIMRPGESLPGLVVRWGVELNAACSQLLVKTVEVACAELHVGAGAHRRCDALHPPADGMFERQQANRPATFPADAYEREIGRCIDHDLEPKRLAIELRRPSHACDRQCESVQVNIDGHEAPLAAHATVATSLAVAAGRRQGSGRLVDLHVELGHDHSGGRDAVRVAVCAWSPGGRRRRHVGLGRRRPRGELTCPSSPPPPSPDWPRRHRPPSSDSYRPPLASSPCPWPSETCRPWSSPPAVVMVRSLRSKILGCPPRYVHRCQ